jgi:hypothetical protein
LYELFAEFGNKHYQDYQPYQFRLRPQANPARVSVRYRARTPGYPFPDRQSGVREGSFFSDLVRDQSTQAAGGWGLLVFKGAVYTVEYMNNELDKYFPEHSRSAEFGVSIRGEIVIADYDPFPPVQEFKDGKWSRNDVISLNSIRLFSKSQIAELVRLEMDSSNS